MSKYKLKTIQDTDAQCPLTDWDNFFKFYSCHKRYYSGLDTIEDKKGNSFKDEVFNSHEEIKNFMEKEGHVWIKVYMYDHGGVTISTKPFSCRWDSGIFGYMYATKKDILDAFGGKILTKALRKRAEEHMEKFVNETWDAYFTGEVYGFKITDEDGEELDSCWGFYGEKYAREEGENIIAAYEEEDSKKTAMIQTNIAYIAILEASYATM